MLGLRLIAKTVNQDDPVVYHLFYGDEHGRPGADLTFFEYPGAKPGRAGAGMVHRIVWRVGSEDALAFWAGAPGREGVEAGAPTGPLRFADPEGLAHELVVDRTDDPPLVADHPEVPAELALRASTACAPTRRPGAACALLEKLMGAARGDDDVGAARRRPRRHDRLRPRAGRARAPSAGTVHHVAWDTPDADLPRWIDRIDEAGIPNSGFVDRHYFHSLYFREPGGILYELATAQPGFPSTGRVAELGSGSSSRRSSRTGASRSRRG